MFEYLQKFLKPGTIVYRDMYGSTVLENAEEVLTLEIIDWEVWDKPRHAKPMTGFFTTLSEEQKKAALEYRGDDTVGQPWLSDPKSFKGGDIRNADTDF